MAPRFAVYMGIDICVGSKPVTFVALGQDRQPVAFGEGDAVDALSYAAGQQVGAIIAINAPAKPNNGRMTQAEVRKSLNPVPENGRWRSLRQAEYELIRLGVEVPHTPNSADHCQPWMRRGFTIVDYLTRMNYCAYPTEQANRQWLEVQSDAAFWSLTGFQPLPAGSLEGRMQRQLALADLELPVPDVMEFFEEITRFKLLRGTLPMKYVLSQAEISAWFAAYTAWLAGNEPHRLRRFGAEEEGVIYLPTAENHRTSLR